MNDLLSLYRERGYLLASELAAAMGFEPGREVSLADLRHAPIRPGPNLPDAPLRSSKIRLVQYAFGGRDRICVYATTDAPMSERLFHRGVGFGGRTESAAIGDAHAHAASIGATAIVHRTWQLESGDWHASATICWPLESYS